MKCTDKARVMAKHFFWVRCMVGRVIAKGSHLSVSLRAGGELSW